MVIKVYQLFISLFSSEMVIPGRVQVFSSYPGVLHSGDDFYLLSSGMVSAHQGPKIACPSIQGVMLELWKVDPHH